MMKPYNIYYDHEIRKFYIKIQGEHPLGQEVNAYMGKEKAQIFGVTEFESSDSLGDYHCYNISYKHKSNSDKSFSGLIKSYEDFVVFETHYNNKHKQKKYKRHLQPYISFPAFEGKHDYDVSVLTYKNNAPFSYPLFWNGTATDSLLEGEHQPLIMVKKSLDTVILSPLNHLLHNVVYLKHKPKRVSCGISRFADGIKSGEVVKTLMVTKNGVNNTLERYGDILRTYYGTKKAEPFDDIFLSHISYWTNAGSAYWYRTVKGASYEETLHRLKAHHNKIGLHFGSYQLDSWWYKRENEQYTGGIVDWEPREEVHNKNFNSMLPFLQKYKIVKLFDNNRMSEMVNCLGASIGCHFKQIASKSVYVEAAPDQFIMDHYAMPKDYDVAYKLFKRIFNHPNWRLSYVIHDWLDFMKDHHKGFRNMTVSQSYFKALNDALIETKALDNKREHLSLQLCMSTPSQTLNSVSMDSVTSIRSTSDSNSFFVEGHKRYWWHLYSSTFIQAMGKYPFYDNRQTSKNGIMPFSSFSKFEMIFLGLSCGPIGLGDSIGKENMALIRRTIKEDGEIIKPDKPARLLDVCYLYNPNGPSENRGVAMSTYSVTDQEQAYKGHYLLTFGMNRFGQKTHMTYSLEDAGLDSGDYMVYDYFRKQVRHQKADLDITYFMKRKKFYYEIVVPSINGIGFFGDVSRHISLSRQLISKVTISKSHILIIGNFADAIAKWLFYMTRAPKGVRLCDETGADLVVQAVTYKDNLLAIEGQGSYNKNYMLEIDL